MKYREIDPEIRDVVVELNARGYRTVASCAGHPEKEETEPVGEILFAKKYPHGRIRQILENFGIKIVSIKEIRNPWYPSPRTQVVFQPLGGLSIESSTDIPIERLPKKSEAVGYFEGEGASKKEAKLLASAMGYKKEDRK